MKTLLAKTVLMVSFLSFNTACAEEAKSPVGPLASEQRQDVGEKPHEDEVELMALQFTGKDAFNTPCTMAIAVPKEDESDEDGHHHEFVTKFDYNIHGETPTDTVAGFYNYQESTDTFFSPEEDVEGSVPALASVLLKDETIKPDVNQVLEYQQQGLLSQFVRMNFNSVDIHVLMESMEQVLEDPSQFDSKKSELNQLQQSVLKISHAGHFDAVACGGFELTGLEVTEFSFKDNHDH